VRPLAASVSRRAGFWKFGGVEPAAQNQEGSRLNVGERDAQAMGSRVNDRGLRLKKFSVEIDFHANASILAQRIGDADRTPVQTEVSSVTRDLHTRRFVDQFRGGDELKPDDSTAFLVHGNQFPRA
jgi:hypothetical protein